MQMYLDSRLEGVLATQESISQGVLPGGKVAKAYQSIHVPCFTTE